MSCSSSFLFVPHALVGGLALWFYHFLSLLSISRSGRYGAPVAALSPALCAPPFAPSMRLSLSIRVQRCGLINSLNSQNQKHSYRNTILKWFLVICTCCSVIWAMLFSNYFSDLSHCLHSLLVLYPFPLSQLYFSQSQISNRSSLLFACCHKALAPLASFLFIVTRLLFSPATHIPS